MKKTLRLLMPQWQGGNNPNYMLGAKLLDWLAPKDDNCYHAEVPVDNFTGNALEIENGVAGRSVLHKQLDAAHNLLEKYKPDRVIVFGGDCLVSQAPFAYLNEKYNGEMGILWLDAHPDISTPEMHNHEHAMVLGNLLGEGDNEFSEKVNVPIKKDMIMYGGLQKMTAAESKVVDDLELYHVGSNELKSNSLPVTDWIKNKKIKHLAVHFDLDVLDPDLFKSLLFTEPGGEPIEASSGKMTLSQIGRLLNDVSKETDIVGLGIAEFLPWDMINLKEFMDSVPIFKSE